MIQNALHPAGIEASRIGSLWNGYMVVLTAVYVIVILWMFVAVWRSHKNAAPRISDTEERPHSITVGVAIGLTTLTLIGLLVASVATGSAVGTYGDKKPDAIEIDVTGHQWWWEVQYPDQEPDKSFKTANEIHIPLHRAVLLRLATRDVIHSLWIPNLNGKRDLIPGRVNKLWIEADRPGVFRSQCAEFCGLQHAHMALVVVAESNEKYQQWKSHQQTPANDPITPEQRHGRDVFLSLPCVNCHAITGVDAYATIGPDLTHLATRPTLAAGELLNTKGNLGGWIVNAPAIKPGTAMPPNQITGNDLQDLLAYLESLR
ncbi:MAG TPA: cytochrome c oxidase subunit II [Thermoanaerobaculia bacterium]